jgi:hypothetical protein
MVSYMCKGELQNAAAKIQKSLIQKDVIFSKCVVLLMCETMINVSAKCYIIVVIISLFI